MASPTSTLTPSPTATETATDTPTLSFGLTEAATDTPTATPEPTEFVPYLVVDRNVFHARLGDRVTVSWALRRTARVQIRIYNCAGEIMVRTFRDEISRGGEVRAAVWDGRNDAGEPVSSGVYLFRVFAPDLLLHHLVGIVN